MQLVKTQKILYNHEFRIRLLADNGDAEFIRLVKKLPDCRWSNHLNSWHTGNIENHIQYFNKIFPSHIRFIAGNPSPYIPKIDENLSEKSITILKNNRDKTLTLKFSFDRDLEVLIQKSGGFLQLINGREWRINDKPEINENLKAYLQNTNYRIVYESVPKSDVDCSIFHSENKNNEENFRRYLVSSNYSKRTIDQYVSNVSQFMGSTVWNSCLSIEGIRDYIDEMSINRNLSRSYQNQLINSLKLYYRYKFGLGIDRSELLRPRRNPSKPIILTNNEVSKIIRLIPNLKHNTLISTIYQTGITVGETVSIRPEDIDNEKSQLFIRGRKDNPGRMVTLSWELKEKLDSYLSCYHPKNYLFEGYNGSRYNERSIQKVLKKYVQKAGITKKASVQTLRHSFACKLVSQGVEIGDLQHILGHSSRKSTGIYCKMVGNELNNN
jgi:site-specific recombinase XerD